MTSDVRSTRTRRVISFLLSLVALAWAPISLAESDGVPPRYDEFDGTWHSALALYGWLPGVSADLRYQLPSGNADSRTNNNIFSYLSGAFMIQDAMRHGDWGLWGDFAWVKFSNEKGRFRNISGESVGGDISLDTRWGLKGGILTLAALYNMSHTPGSFNDFLFGVRYLWIKGNLDWNFNIVGNNGFNIANSGSASRNEGLFDAVVGLRGRWAFTDDLRWYVPYYLDVGAGSSNWTAQGVIGIGYSFDWGDLGLDFRDVTYKQSGGNDFLRRLSLAGPMFKVSWYF